MRQSATQDGFTLRVIAGTYSVILAMDLAPERRAGCLGFSIQRTDLGPVGGPAPAAPLPQRWLPNMLRFPRDTAGPPITTDRAPIQKFRWGDYTAKPGHGYRYTVSAQYGTWDHLTPGATVAVEIATEDPTQPETAVNFNRAAAASEAYQAKFGATDPAQSADARAWLSRGLEEALLAFLTQAQDTTDALHAAIYEFQKPELLQGLTAAMGRGAAVQVVYHYRNAGHGDDTWTKNAAAAAAAGLDGVAVRRKANPQNAISHNKFVVLLKDGAPQAVWTGSTNWTDGALYGQLNVGHAVYDPQVAATYDQYFQLLRADSEAPALKTALAALTRVAATAPANHGIYPILSPQPDDTMLALYASIASGAQSLFLCAPFELAPAIRQTLSNVPAGRLHFLLVDKTGSLGPTQEATVIEGDTSTEVSAATTLASPLHDYQNQLLAGHESFHHAGVHIHAKFIIADPLGDDPTLVTGSANFSANSTLHNDSNSLLIRGNTHVVDIYATEFMRMFDHYLFRGFQAQATASDTPLGLKEDDSWTARYYVEGSAPARGRQLFAGTLP